MVSNRRTARDSGAIWITNIAAPYRRPLWRALARNVPLTVCLLESDQALLRDGRRMQDWTSGASTWAERSPGLSVRHVPVLRLARGETAYYLAMGRLMGPDASHVVLGGWESPAYWQALAAARARGIRTIGFYESTQFTNRYRHGPIARARSLFFRSLDAVVVPGPAARRAVEGFGVNPLRVHEGFNAVDVRRFHRAGHHRERASGHRFVYVGQLIPRKNLRSLMLAFAYVRERGDTLTFLGSGEERENLEAQARGLGASDAIFFSNSVDNEALADWLARFDTLVLPSIEEVWGLVVNEALAAGMHVVVSARAGVAESVRGMRGVYSTDVDARALGEALDQSRREWTGTIRNPEILEHTPERFAKVFLSAMSVSDMSDSGRK